MMLMIDKDLLKNGQEFIDPFSQDKVQNIGYDLSTEFFCMENTFQTSCDLAPGAFVFVQCREEIRLSNDVCAHIVLRNKRIRQGLDLSAPVYQPGHHTKVFFRITNISKSMVKLTTEDDFATLMLYKLSENVQKPYQGKFSGEFDFRDIAKYDKNLADEMVDIEKKVEDVRQIEKSIYGNVLAIMGIFVAIFSLINVNIQLVSQSVAMKTLLTLNLVTVGSISALIAAIQAVIPATKKNRWIFMVAGIAYAAAIVLQFLQF